MEKKKCEYCGEYYDPEYYGTLDNGCPACPKCVKEEEEAKKAKTEEE